MLFSAQPAELPGFLSVCQRQVHFTDGGVDDAVFVVTVTNWPALAFLTASATFGVTVPTLGLASGRADPEPGPAGQQRACIRRSNNNVKVHFAFLDLVSRSSIPTSSAPAALAASAFAPG